MTEPHQSDPTSPIASTTERALIAGIAGFFLLAFVAVLWMVGGEVTLQYRMDCDRATASCTLTRRRLVGSETYRVPIPDGARAVVRVTARKARSAPRTFLELADGAGRTFLVEYEGRGAGERAAAAATRLDAFLDGRGEPVLEEREGTGRPSSALVVAVLAFAAAVVAVVAVARRSRWKAGAEG